MAELPFVSVIVPVYNASGFIAKLLDCLLMQDYPEHRREIIIVDNNSSDDTKEIISRYPFILAQENDIQSSYAARNAGLKIAKGDIIAFTDADCQPSQCWISEGVKTLLPEGVDLVAGQVKFIYSEKPTATELYDSITHMQMESEVSEKGIAPTANLFAKRHIFDAIGLFDSRVKSGGDTQWTGKATRSGYKLTYSEEAVVMHPTRKFREFAKKVIRTGSGKAHSRLAAGHSVLHEFFYFPYAVLFKAGIDKQRLLERFESKSLAKFNVSFRRIATVGVVTNCISHLSALVEFWHVLVLILLGKYKVKKNG